jgi:hypothetical protein
MNINLQMLRAKIRGFQVTSETIRKKINKTSRKTRHDLWNKKRILGNYCRSHLIAYGLLRNISYDKIEKHSLNNKPDFVKILSIVIEHTPWPHNTSELRNCTHLRDLENRMIEKYQKSKSPQKAPEKGEKL